MKKNRKLSDFAEAYFRFALWVSGAAVLALSVFLAVTAAKSGHWAAMAVILFLLSIVGAAVIMDEC